MNVQKDDGTLLAFVYLKEVNGDISWLNHLVKNAEPAWTVKLRRSKADASKIRGAQTVSSEKPCSSKKYSDVSASEMLGNSESE